MIKLESRYTMSYVVTNITISIYDYWINNKIGTNVTATTIIIYVFINTALK